MSWCLCSVYFTICKNEIHINTDYTNLFVPFFTNLLALLSMSYGVNWKTDYLIILKNDLTLTYMLPHFSAAFFLKMARFFLFLAFVEVNSIISPPNEIIETSVEVFNQWKETRNAFMDSMG